MKKWTKTIVIHAPIDQVWNYFDGSLENMQKMMPQVVDHQPIKITEEGVGSIYRQKYQEGKRIEEYEVETIKYKNEDQEKELKIQFNLANMFDISAHYTLEKIDSETTKFTYSTTNNPLKWYVKPFLLFASDKVVVKFLDRVKHIAETEYTGGNK
ncbi:SRPBCC family protein [Gracilibacillus kekensis]|uniref:Polyketide cyclase / dehydrase and lipid transport n=1 Tax=Gracilibacillus kekensis TaxID=1027249 RepID=A0A1M7QGV7_9BACI|nr:SRPBCC family protein [Gracilibacillus kekensis]SHN30362.1 Polyketide cyclase / dehydrase and lipid transport [Gracilibacillus kekensis]